MSANHVLALCGGVGGAKLAAGLAAVLPPEQLTIVVNTGDDFEHIGLSISPDIDTVVYTLSGLSDQVRGWGVADESWQAMAQLGRLGEAQWFQLGDRDLAMHLARTRRLRAGETLSAITASLAGRLGIGPALVPMSDDPVRTKVSTADGELDFQRYFVAEQCRPVARGIRFDGAEAARPSPGFAAALERGDLGALIVCPSNPYLSIDPLLALPGVRERIAGLAVPRVAVSPIVAGQAIKGPTAKLMSELGADVDVTGVARHYRGLIDILIVDEADRASAAQIADLGMTAVVAPSVMRSDADRVALAAATLAAAAIEIREELPTAGRE
ncbi:MAG TPA: 2-phospho-L-lactate transferase [Phenylobacterium sp.]|uniref:2-phospho-L-lactate transferase n=1 Tax=Phenylobacterium sp. TaxID=1871053 RepID=UPI002B48C39E|nr:2-phospho-L-lactate transferase [Phenylobacterium sp.]HKR89872.1 2-phospho-L-lactate transferase [Phenylobacterium sp.]